MPQYIDSYYLVDSRKSTIIYDFLDAFSVDKKSLADDYPIPQYSDKPEKVFQSDSDLMSYLEDYVKCQYLIYWENANSKSEIKQFTLQYTDDQKMIIGVSIIGNDPRSQKSVQLFRLIKNYLTSQNACITIEEAPPANSIEFVSFCNERYVPVLLDL